MADLRDLLRFIYLFLDLLAGCTTVYAEVSVQRFIRQARPNVKMLQPQLALSHSTTLTCAFECTRRPGSCLSFAYYKENKTCLIGLWVVPDATATTPKQLYQYSTGSFCDTTANFSVVTNGSVSVCMWLSTYTANWTTARSECQAMGAQLYTSKSQEKMNILIDIIKKNDFDIFIGLSDLVTEGTFVWEDGTVLTDPWRKSIFPPGYQPDDYLNNQDCVKFSQGLYFDDDGCSYQYRFLCEINQHGL